jgi:hypothetical protein
MIKAEDKILEKERSRDFELSRSDRFRYRTRYFTDSGIIRSKEFVAAKHRGLFFTLNKLDKIFILLLSHKLFIDSNLTDRHIVQVNQRFRRL